MSEAFDQILKVCEELKKLRPEGALDRLRIVQNEFLPDDMIIVSKKVYEAINRAVPKNESNTLTEKYL